MQKPLTHEFFMEQALKEAQKAFEQDEVPIGAVITINDMVIARAYNYTEHLTDVTAHAEMQAFTAAANYLGSKYLQECTLYVTIEPCVMCAGASCWTQIGRIVYGAKDEKKGFSLINDPVLHPKTKVINGVMEKECKALIQEFFRRKRT
ncbi:MAG: nucleoside deaminase [Bacteroidota bacterium]|nr:nucleoside deaminase [Bacteroidota bacterium]